MTAYRFTDHVYTSEHPRWSDVLRKAHAAQLRPACQCRPEVDNLHTYISLIRGQYVLRRMPNTGSLHAPHCEHYEPPAELSGLGQVQGSAIVENADTRLTALALDFPLTKGRARVANAASEVEHESVRSTGTKLTMRGLLHFLMDDAGLTRWSPAMAGRRSWYVVRRELLKAAASKIAKGQALSTLLHIPETFSLERADDIRRRQQQSLARLAESASNRVVLLAEVKSIEDARFGKSLVVKHMPDTRLMLTDALHKHLVARFSRQLQLWGQLDASHLMLLATISRSLQGVLCVEAVCVMNVNEHWLPFESLYEWELLDALHRAERRFTKGLRYNLPASKPLASAVLQDTGSRSTALFVVPQDMEAEYAQAIEDLTDNPGLQAWKWQAGAEPMPALPEISPRGLTQGQAHGSAQSPHPPREPHPQAWQQEAPTPQEQP